MKRIGVILAALGMGLVSCSGQAVYRLKPAKSVVEVHLGTAGVLGFAGHRHLIRAPIEKGSFVYCPGDPGKSSVELVVDAGALRVMDPEVSAKDRQEVQATMQSDRVLGIKRFPKIVFKSVRIEELGRNRLKITGDLTIRNQTHPVTVEAMLEEAGAQLKATGTSQFKQTTFGIRPVTAALGTVRVRDRIDITFQVFGQVKPGHSS